MKRENLIAAIEDVIESTNHHGPAARHFWRLKQRLKAGRKLTKKMTENLTWIVAKNNKIP